MHSCLSILTNNNCSDWVKKDNNMLDVTMESCMVAEISDLVGLFLLERLQEVLILRSYGIDRGDGLAILHKAS